MPLQRHDLSLFADYFQVYVCDARYVTDTGVIWDDPAASERMLAAGPDLIAVGTARNMDVSVALEIHPGEPLDDGEDWEQVIECSLAVPSGQVIAFGCTDMPDEAERYEVAPGHYRARVCYANLEALSEDGLDGDDRYRVQLWPGAPTGISVIKRRPEASCVR